MQHCISCDTQLTPEEAICPYCNTPQAANAAAQKPHFEGLGLLEDHLSSFEKVEAAKPALANTFQPLPPPQRPARSPRQKALIAVLLCILVATLGVLGYRVYADTTSHPNQVNDQSTATAQATLNAVATATAQANDPQFLYDRATSAVPTFSDRLSDAQSSDWKSGIGKYGDVCNFENGAFYVKAKKTNIFFPCYNQHKFSNFVLQVQMTIVEGDAGAILFRANQASNTFYALFIHPNGRYTLDMYPDNNVAHIRKLTRASLRWFNIGLNKSNLIAIVAHDNVFSLVINKKFDVDITDPDQALSQGLIALGAEDQKLGTTVAFQNVQEWDL